MHYHQYEYREPQPRNSELVRNRLNGRPKRTFETVDEAVAWHEQWMGEVPRPLGYWGVGSAQEETPYPVIVVDPERGPTDEQRAQLDAQARLERVKEKLAPFRERAGEAPEEYRERMRAEGEARKVKFTRSALERGAEVVDSFWSGPQVITATLIPCPPRVIPGFPEPPRCPTGHA